MPKSQLKKVISASRRIDMVGCFPQETAEMLAAKCPPEKIHSLVIWTKNPNNMFNHSALHAQILKYDQLFVHFTVTGMGQTRLEPRVPTLTRAMKFLPELIELVGLPERIRFRFDPIVHLKMPDGSEFTNLPVFREIAPQLKACGIRNVSISWMSVYKKVKARLARHNIEIIPISQAQIVAEAGQLTTIAENHRLTLHFCSIPELPVSRCIDGTALSALHPNQEVCSQKRARGQRKLCGCTESWDIGWYHPCSHGCLYCYANPVS